MNILSIIGGVGAVMSGFYALLCALGIIMSNPLTAAVAAIILAAIALAGYTFKAFIEGILETENKDGFGYVWTPTKTYLLFGYFIVTWIMSFGRWRDWNWSLYVLGWEGGGGFGMARCY